MVRAWLVAWGLLGCAETLPAVAPQVMPAVVEQSAADATPVPADEPTEPIPTWTRWGPVECTPAVPQSGLADRALALPAGIEGPLAEAARAIAGGPSDPRGMEMREVEIWDSDVWTDGRVHARAGFVRPAAAGERPFVLVRGDLVAAVGVGPPIDLERACDELVAAISTPGEARDWDAVDGLADRCPGVFAVIALADRGAADAARRLATALEGDPHDRWISLVRSERSFADFERAITAHMRGDDCLALHLARGVADRYRRVLADDRAAHRSSDDVAYVAEIDRLLRDQERRARDGRAAVPVVAEEGPVPADLVPQLIAALEEVDQRQWGQPGGVPLSVDPIVRALIRVGEPAVPALLHALEHDDRLTRSVHFWRAFAPPRNIISVYEAAYTAIANILETSFFTIAATGDDLTARGASYRSRLAAAIRRTWELIRDLPPAERRLRMLADDAARSHGWAEAAGWIVARDGGSVRRIESSMTIDLAMASPPDAPMRGEGLRGAHDPTVAELLVRRAEDALTDDDEGRACTIADAAFEWDASAAQAGLRRFARRCLRADWCSCAPRLAATLGGDDPSLLRAYSRQSDRGGSDLSAYDLWPIVAHPGSSDMRRLARAFFDDREGPTANDASEFVTTRTLTIPELRAYLARRLRERSEVGEVAPSEGGLHVRYATSRVTGGYEIRDGGALTTPQPIRACDLWADALRTQLAIELSLAWPEARRDEAIAAMIAALEQEPSRWQSPLAP